ncbi:unnamed protein product [Gongylonema pulchrum]|uniref:Uncharacterized protein n=1 Tax=Gongylonema pulchrum TaxID=637853 RepID=A0A3P7PLZ4_9BILA|nr:unnamed protein product [Gongylonema pulchrum]
MEVNDESLLGCSQEEAARALRRSGNNVPSPPQVRASIDTKRGAASGSDRHEACPSALSNSDTQGILNSTATSLSPVVTRASEITTTVASISDDGPLATSSPLPPSSVSLLAISVFLMHETVFV